MKSNSANNDSHSGADTVSASETKTRQELSQTQHLGETTDGGDEERVSLRNQLHATVNGTHENDAEDDVATLLAIEEVANALLAANVQQLVYLILTAAWPHETKIKCAVLAGYAENSARVTIAKIDRKPHIRDIRARLTAETGSDVAESPVLDMDDEALKAWHTGVIQNPRASIKEQQASAIELARLKGYHKREGSGGDGMINMMDELIAHKAWMKG